MEDQLTTAEASRRYGLTPRPAMGGSARRYDQGAYPLESAPNDVGKVGLRPPLKAQANLRAS